jgi:hypothetical protein
VLAASTPFNDVAPFSLEAWAFHPTIPPTTGYQVYLMDETRDTGPLDGYALLLSNNLGVYAERAAGGINRLTPRQAVAAGAWHHVVGTYDGTTLTLYVDGVLASANQNVGEQVSSVGSKADIGSQSTSAPTGLLDGLLDEVALYDHALTPERVAEHYRIGVNGPD